MSETVSWIWLDCGRRPEENQVVNVWAKNNLTGCREQFLATYTSYRVQSKKIDVWTPLGDMLMFDSSSVTAWAYRIAGPTWVYGYFE